MVHRGLYLAPDDTSSIESVLAALKERPRGAELLVAGNLNVKLLEPGEEYIAAVLVTEGLEDMSVHFLPRWRSWFRDGRSCSMIRAGREVRSRTYYIPGKDSCLFWNVSFRDPRHKLDRYMVLGCLRSNLLMEHSR